MIFRVFEVPLRFRQDLLLDFNISRKCIYFQAFPLSISSSFSTLSFLRSTFSYTLFPNFLHTLSESPSTISTMAGAKATKAGSSSKSAAGNTQNPLPDYVPTEPFITTIPSLHLIASDDAKDYPGAVINTPFGDQVLVPPAGKKTKYYIVKGNRTARTLKTCKLRLIHPMDEPEMDGESTHFFPPDELY